MNAVLNAGINPSARLTATISPAGSIQAEVAPGASLRATITQGPMITSGIPNYEGPYEIRPAVQVQELQTAEKRMKDNLLILEIPYAEVTNTSGGMTATIG